jgi:hypothetical protein
MNLLQGKTNQYLREAILENNVERARKYLTLKIGTADVEATTEVRRCFVASLNERSRLAFLCCIVLPLSEVHK